MSLFDLGGWSCFWACGKSSRACGPPKLTLKDLALRLGGWDVRKGADCRGITKLRWSWCKYNIRTINAFNICKAIDTSSWFCVSSVIAKWPEEKAHHLSQQPPHLRHYSLWDFQSPASGTRFKLETTRQFLSIFPPAVSFTVSSCLTID